MPRVQEVVDPLPAAPEVRVGDKGWVTIGGMSNDRMKRLPCSYLAVTLQLPLQESSTALCLTPVPPHVSHLLVMVVGLCLGELIVVVREFEVLPTAVDIHPGP